MFFCFLSVFWLLFGVLSGLLGVLGGVLERCFLAGTSALPGQVAKKRAQRAVLEKLIGGFSFGAGALGMFLSFLRLSGWGM